MHLDKSNMKKLSFLLILTVIVSVTVILWMLRILQTVTTEDVERLYHKKGETI